MTASELVVTATIWLLTASGGFFALRGAWRRRRGSGPPAPRRKSG